jgi:chemotaxis protein CheX
MCDAVKHEQLVEMIRQVTKDVFTTMFDLEVQVGEPFIERASAESFDGVMSLIGMAGSSWVGTGSLSCGSRTACRLSSALLMEEISAVDDQVLDSIGELTNVLIGNVKGEIEQQLGTMALSVPIVVRGCHLTAHALCHGCVWTVVPFTFGDDRIDVKICLTERELRETETERRPRAMAEA